MVLKITGIVLLIIVAVVTVFTFYVRYRFRNAKDKGDMQNSVDKAAEKFVGSGKSYGLVTGIYKQGNIYIKGYGTIKQGSTIAPDESTIMELASTSKLFTTSVLQLLCDEGLLHLDDKIADLLKDKVTLPASAQQTTLRQLAIHTSGFPSLPQSFIDKMTDESNPYKDLSVQDLYDYLRHCTGKKPEGEFEYSNFGMGLLGHILELKTGTKYEMLVKGKLLSRLAMNNTFITADSVQQSRIAQGYNEAGAPNPIWLDTVLTGAGSFLSDAQDMLRFINANLAQDRTPVSRSLLKTHEPQPGGETGLGWILPSATDRFIGNEHVLWHNGMAGGYASFLAIDKVAQNGVIILSDKAVDVTPLGMKLMWLVRTQSWKRKD